jgi:pentatricopeptide repeat protein
MLCCAGVGDWEGAITLLDEMRTLKLQPDERIYGAAMRACRYTSLLTTLMQYAAI